MITVCDSTSHPVPISLTAGDIDRIAEVGFMFYHGERREVLEIHRTKSGMQIELFAL